MTTHWQVILLWLSLAIASGDTASGQEKSPAGLPPKEQFHLFLLAGQSNMAGRGRIADEDRVPHARIFALNKEDEWVPAVDPIHFDKPVAGVCLGRSFARVLADRDPSITVGLIPCAVGGSPISSWQPGGYHSQTKSHPYDDAIRRARIAMETGTLKAILWHQGESDSRPELAERYEQELHALIERFRKDLGIADLPFLVGQLGHFPDRPWDEARRRVNQAHESLPDKVPRTAFVSSAGLAHKGDKVHFNSASLREFGRRYAHAYLDLIHRADSENPPVSP